MLLDLDNFKTINDTLGHPYGDKVLISISDLLKNHISKGTILSRFGGDEFTILIPDSGDTNKILAQAEQIIGLFKNPLLVNSQEIYITPSIGICIFLMIPAMSHHLLRMLIQQCITLKVWVRTAASFMQKK